MTHQDDTVRDRLLGLLGVERDAIRNADFPALADLAAQKQTEIARLGTLSPQDLSRLRNMAKENQRLLAAALEGVHAAQRRLQDILAASKGFNAYTRSGQSTEIRSDRGSVERRA